MSRKIAFALAVLLLLTGLGLSCNGDSFGRPTIDEEEIQFRGLGLDGIQLLLVLTVNNPNPFGVTITEIEADIYYEQDGEWEYLGRAERTEDILIQADGPTTLEIPITLGTTETLRALVEFLGPGGGSLPIRADGSLLVDVQVTEVRIPFDYEREITVEDVPSGLA